MANPHNRHLQPNNEDGSRPRTASCDASSRTGAVPVALHEAGGLARNDIESGGIRRSDSAVQRDAFGCTRRAHTRRTRVSPTAPSRDAVADLGDHTPRPSLPGCETASGGLIWYLPCTNSPSTKVHSGCPHVDDDLARPPKPDRGHRPTASSKVGPSSLAHNPDTRRADYAGALCHQDLTTTTPRSPTMLAVVAGPPDEMEIFESAWTFVPLLSDLPPTHTGPCMERRGSRRPHWRRPRPRIRVRCARGPANVLTGIQPCLANMAAVARRDQQHGRLEFGIRRRGMERAGVRCIRHRPAAPCANDSNRFDEALDGDGQALHPTGNRRPFDGTLLLIEGRVLASRSRCRSHTPPIVIGGRGASKRTLAGPWPGGRNTGTFPAAGRRRAPSQGVRCSTVTAKDIGRDPSEIITSTHPALRSGECRTRWWRKPKALGRRGDSTSASSTCRRRTRPRC